MTMTDPEEELDAFLASQPSWRRKWLQYDGSWSSEEIVDWPHSDPSEDSAVRERYLVLLRRVPGKWRQYRSRLKKIALAALPQGKPGRPRKDDLANEARQLQQAGKSHAQIAAALNRKYGPDCTTTGAIAKLLASRKRAVPQDKT